MRLGPNGQFYRVNQRFSAIIGQTAKRLEGQSLVNIVHLDDVERVGDLLARVLANESPFAQEEARFVHADGSLIQGNLTLSLVRDAQDNPKYYIAVIEDVTQRSERQEQFISSQRLEAVGQLASGIAHEFNNMLMAVIGNLEILHDREITPDRHDKHVMAAEKAAWRGAELTSRLLAYARCQTLAPRRADLNALVSENLTIMGNTLGETVRLVCNLAGDLRPVEIDRAQMEVALANLATNARDAMPEGGRLTISTANAVLDRSVLEVEDGIRNGAYVVLSVTDTGTGMTPEVSKRAIEPFYTTKDVGQGVGLGLSMVHGFAHQSGGGLTIESEAGVGSTFKIYLPGDEKARGD